jgi:hypothetical protein
MIFNGIASAGSFTPTISAAGGASGQTYAAQAGIYVKIWRFVLAIGDVQLSAKGTLTGQLRLAGFPFTGDGTVSQAITFGYFSGLATAVTMLLAHVGAGTYADMYMLTAAATAPTAMTGADIGSSARFMYVAAYLTN